MQRLADGSTGDSRTLARFVRLRAVAVLLISAFVALSGPVRAAVGAYDIVLIVTDDQRWDTLQYMPNVKTHLINKGVTFTNAFVTTPMCCPSRASILTGQYAHTHGVLDNDYPDGGATVFNPNTAFVVWLRQQTAYRLGFVGKYLNEWTLISRATPPGWHHFVGYRRMGYYNYTLAQNGDLLSFGSQPDEYATAVLTSKAVEFIEQTPPGTRLLLEFTPFNPHSPSTPAPEDVNAFPDLQPWRPPSYNEVDVTDKPLWVRQLPLITTDQQTRDDGIRRLQLQSLLAVDRAVGKIVEALERTGRLGTTVIIFMSDNGLSWGEHRWRHAKQCPYEECTRIPLVIRDPGAAPVPRTQSNLVLNIDIAPTILSLAGDVRPGVRMQGQSLVSLMRGPANEWRRAVLIEMLGVPTDNIPERPRYRAIRTSRYLYVEYYMTGERELYDLALDPYQLTNAYGKPEYADTVSELKPLLDILATR